MKELEDFGFGNFKYNPNDDDDDDDDDELFLEKDQRRRELIKTRNRIKRIQERKYRQTMPVNINDLKKSVDDEKDDDLDAAAAAAADKMLEGDAQPKITRNALIVQELVTTERTYLESLMQLVTKFVVPSREGGVLTAEDSQALFSNTESLYQLHSEFLAYLEEAYATNGSIGELFVRFGPMFRLYKEYAAEHNKALSTLERLSKNRSFMDFCMAPMGVSDTTPDGVYLYVTSLLITPIQRIPRYLLLLKDLTAHTDPSSDEYSHLKKANLLLSEIAGEVNQCK